MNGATVPRIRPWFATLAAAAAVSTLARPSTDVTLARRAANLHREMFVMDAHTHMVNRQLFHGGNIGDHYLDGQVDLPRLIRPSPAAPERR